LLPRQRLGPSLNWSSCTGSSCCNLPNTVRSCSGSGLPSPSSPLPESKDALPRNFDSFVIPPPPPTALFSSSCSRISACRPLTPPPTSPSVQPPAYINVFGPPAFPGAANAARFCSIAQRAVIRVALYIHHIQFTTFTRPHHQHPKTPSHSIFCSALEGSAAQEERQRILTPNRPTARTILSASRLFCFGYTPSRPCSSHRHRLPAGVHLAFSTPHQFTAFAGDYHEPSQALPCSLAPQGLDPLLNAPPAARATRCYPPSSPAPT
jgi:hypothetical protein